MKISKIILITLSFLMESQIHAQEKSLSTCLETYENILKSMKLNEGQYDANINKYYNLFYLNKDVTRSVPSELGNFFQESGAQNSSDYVRNTFKVDLQTGLIFLYTESRYSWKNATFYYLRVFHPISGPVQFYYDSKGGQLLLPKQNQKVSFTSRGYSPELGFVLKVTDDRENFMVTTEIKESFGDLSYLFDKEGSLNDVTNYPDSSIFYSFYGTKKIIDETKSTNVEVKYYPTYEEKLRIFRAGGLPRQDLENPNFYILKSEKKEVFKNEVYGRKGTRHFLNDCFEELQSSYSTYFIYKKDGKYGILNSQMDRLKNSTHLVTENIYDKVVWNQGTETFTVFQNNISSILDIKSIASESRSSIIQNSSGKIPDGIKVTYRADGSLESRIEYKDGEINGIMERYDYWDDPKDVKLSFRCEMKNGKMNGRCEFYVNENYKYLNGKLNKKRSGIYENDVKVSNLP